MKCTTAILILVAILALIVIGVELSSDARSRDGVLDANLSAAGDPNLAGNVDMLLPSKKQKNPG